MADGQTVNSEAGRVIGPHERGLEARIGIGRAMGRLILDPQWSLCAAVKLAGSGLSSLPGAKSMATGMSWCFESPSPRGNTSSVQADR